MQQFPKDWEFAGSVDKKYVQIGNAVPVGLGYVIGRMVRRVMRRTAQKGHLHLSRRGKIVCGDPELEKRILKRKKTQLHPVRLRKNPDLEAAKEWLKASSAPEPLHIFRRVASN